MSSDPSTSSPAFRSGGNSGKRVQFEASESFDKGTAHYHSSLVSDPEGGRRKKLSFHSTCHFGPDSTTAADVRTGQSVESFIRHSIYAQAEKRHNKPSYGTHTSRGTNGPEAPDVSRKFPGWTTVRVPSKSNLMALRSMQAQMKDETQDSHYGLLVIGEEACDVAEEGVTVTPVSDHGGLSSYVRTFFMLNSKDETEKWLLTGERKAYFLSCCKTEEEYNKQCRLGVSKLDKDWQDTFESAVQKASGSIPSLVSNISGGTRCIVDPHRIAKRVASRHKGFGIIFAPSSAFQELTCFGDIMPLFSAESESSPNRRRIVGMEAIDEVDCGVDEGAAADTQSYGSGKSGTLNASDPWNLTSAPDPPDKAWLGPHFSNDTELVVLGSASDSASDSAKSL